jgi:excisionase family DNA binding protein
LRWTNEKWSANVTDQLAHEQQQPTEHADASVLRTPAVRKSRRTRPTPPAPETVGADARFVSVKTLAEQWDCSRTTVSRLLEQGGVQAYFLGRGRNGSKRYLKIDVESFLSSVERA